ncbi:PREDICTED: protein CHUP1, chloroplastic-like isoform X1 [Lupinus angustifolius]|uniref:protein CHUP1, chloroplastic-like isoform X1 n=1 Tax=Lupinus angustifolius TaxID=3871 RepID=UPI00092E6D0F|nr:PREDICTED: protein CHUP1, chloroplastic-like isoform X1 [Lupinus angustifolius]
MKQKTPPPQMTTSAATRSVLKQNQPPPQPLPPQPLPPRQRTSSKVPKSPPEVVNGVSMSSSTRAKSVPPELKKISKVKRGLVLNKAKSNEEVVGSQKGSREVEEAKVVVGVKKVFVLKKELQEKLEVSDNLIKDLQSEVLKLKAELDKVKSLNVKLESQNRKLSEDLAAAEAKVEKMKNVAIGEHQSHKFKDIQKLIADKLERSKVKKEATSETFFVQTPIPTHAAIHAISETSSTGRKSPPKPCLPPPPPPPPPVPSCPSAKLANTQNASSVVQLFHSLKNQDEKKDSKRHVNHSKLLPFSAHSSIVGEIQNRSAHLLAIRADIETKGEFINGLIKKVVDASYKDIEDVLKFVDWLDGELSSLADERAVLKHFKWPERKGDAMREAAIEYRELKLLEHEISSYKDDPDLPCGSTLKKIASLLDKSERNMQKLIKLRSSSMRSYQEYNIPTAWMLDSGMMSKIKQASMTLVKIYMKRVTTELESIRNSNRESSHDSLLLQGVHFAYRAHQFAGGLDSETLCAFEEIRRRVQGHLVGSRELLAGIASS